MYDYLEELKNDIREYVEESEETFADRDELNDELWANDSVTGNASGSYWCNAAKAKECIMGDDNAEDYIRNLIGDFGIEADEIAKHFMDWEYWDVSIRCYLLGQALDEMDDEELHIEE